MIERLAGRAALGSSGAMAGILAEAFNAPEQRWSVASVEGTLAAPGTVALLAPDRSAPLGCALLRVAADDAEILTLAVLRRARRQGLGLGLVAACLEAAAAGGALRLHLEVGASNGAARALYARAGFSEAGRRLGYYRGEAGREDAVLMSLGIAP